MGMLVVRGFGSAFDQMHGLEDRLNDRLIPYGSVEHEVVERTRGPVGVEIVLHVGDALAVDRSTSSTASSSLCPSAIVRRIFSERGAYRKT